jgi:hypothetical protein
MKGIKNPSPNNDFSYAHSVLQSLGCLDCAKLFLQFSNLNTMRDNPQYSLTSSLFDLIKDLINGNEGNSQNVISSFINSYNNNSSIIQTQNVLSSDPFHFLYFLIQFLHIENNMPPNINYDVQILHSQNLQNQRNDDYMFNLFKDFWNQTQNSMISSYFFSVERYTYSCPNCGIYFNYGMKNLFRINTDITRHYRDLTFPIKKGTNISLYDCLKCYIGGYKKVCKNCGNSNIDKYTKIIFPASVFIIVLERSDHCFKGDIDFEINIDINEYVSKSRTIGSNINCNYILKACISYCSARKYFADCYLKGNNAWFRFMDNDVKMLNGVREIYECEPQILIYELKEDNNYFNPFYNSLMNQNYNSNNSIKELINNQIKMLQSNNFKQRVYNNALFNGVNVGITIHNKNKKYNNNNNLN